ncbi:S8 family serine peptidase [Laspinema sp. D1]|uniref:S8 family serine peptidase n=1 Tax=Laspinema palackyanum D2a TaxID=2953684 RepID=A0ABT2MST9_9CYAN|nr:S8 family serine peptidase [Laspinema sp. D2a]
MSNYGETALPLRKTGISGAAICIGHLDTGVCLSSNLGLRDFVEEFRFFDEDGRLVSTTPTDTGTHGTQTAAIIHQIAPDAKLFAAAVIDEGHIYTRILAGLEWLLNQPIQVLAMAIGVPIQSLLFERMLEKLVAKDILIVVPSGNSGTGVIFTPAWSPHVLTVGAVDANNQPAPYSSSINAKDGDCIKPEILAPGEIEQQKGTSMASSYVAGVAALLRQQFPKLTAMEIREKLIACCNPVSKEYEYKVKFGVIDMNKVMTLFDTNAKSENA